MTAMYIPTRRLDVQETENWEAEARAFAEEIAEAEGTRQPCFELWYPAPAHLTPEDAAKWLAVQENAFDAIQLDLDAADPEQAIQTLPPYAEMSA